MLDQDSCKSTISRVPDNVRETWNTLIAPMHLQGPEYRAELIKGMVRSYVSKTWPGHIVTGFAEITRQEAEARGIRDGGFYIRHRKMTDQEFFQLEPMQIEAPQLPDKLY